jgi:hypothetical protein
VYLLSKEINFLMTELFFVFNCNVIVRREMFGLLQGRQAPDGTYMFIPKIPIKGVFWRALERITLVYCKAI